MRRLRSAPCEPPCRSQNRNRARHGRFRRNVGGACDSRVTGELFPDGALTKHDPDHFVYGFQNRVPEHALRPGGWPRICDQNSPRPRGCGQLLNSPLEFERSPTNVRHPSGHVLAPHRVHLLVVPKILDRGLSENIKFDGLDGQFAWTALPGCMARHPPARRRRPVCPTSATPGRRSSRGWQMPEYSRSRSWPRSLRYMNRAFKGCLNPPNLVDYAQRVDQRPGKPAGNEI